MPLTLEPPSGDAIDLEEVVARLDERGVDLTDPDSVEWSADLLARLGRNRSFLAERIMTDLKASFRQQLSDNRYSAQVFLLHRSGRRHYLRANLWPSAADFAYQASGPAHFAYDLPHDHNFNFLTVGYLGPGYISDYYEHDATDVAGYPGEALDLHFVERSALAEGKVMLYRAHRDIHCQLPPERLSVSLNIMDEGEHIPWRDQFIVNLEHGSIARAPSLSQSEALLRAAVHQGGEDARDVAQDFARRHPVARVRANALLSLAAVADTGTARAAMLEQGLGDPHPRVRQSCLQRLALAVALPRASGDGGGLMDLERAAAVIQRTAAQLSAGDILSAFDGSAAALADGIDSPALRYLHVRALALLGDGPRALAAYTALDIAAIGDADALSLEGRIRKDMAFAGAADDRPAMLMAAGEAYARAWDKSGAYFPAINAASLRAMGGDGAGARALADIVLADPVVAAMADYWATATRIEALVLLGRDVEALAIAPHALGLAGTDHAARASTCLQLRRLAETGAVPADSVAPLVAILRPGPVVTYSGRMFRQDAVVEAALAARIAGAMAEVKPSAVIGPLACGADILFAEAALTGGHDLTIVLPFHEEDFIAQSVTSGGEGWLARYQQCRGRAARLVLASDSRFVGDDSQFAAGSEMVMGLSRIRAASLETIALQLAVVDADVAQPGAVAGTRADMALWQAAGGETRVVAVDGLDRRLEFSAALPLPEDTTRGLFAIVFADFAGFSRLGEGDLPLFVARVMGGIADVLDQHGDAVLYRNSWGDALYAVISDPLIAARLALDLQAELAVLPDALGGGRPGTGMRVGVHYGSVYHGRDRVAGRDLWYGTEVTRTARIEPVTPSGSVYCTEAFAAVLALAPAHDLHCRYVGRVSLAKGYGELSMYRLAAQD